MLKLCYVEQLTWGLAALYYMDKDVEDVWGDDWDDIPYEHNAGEPYVNDGDTLEKIIVEVPYESSMVLPCDGYLNSPYSVEMINTRQIPWIKFIDGNHLYTLNANSTIEDLYDIARSSEIEMTIYRQNFTSNKRE